MTAAQCNASSVRDIALRARCLWGPATGPGPVCWGFSAVPGTVMPDFAFDDLEDDNGYPQSGDRLQILSAEEYEMLWSSPRFTRSDRDLFFTLTAPERQALEQRRSTAPSSNSCCISATSRPLSDFSAWSFPPVRDALDYLHRRYFLPTRPAPSGPVQVASTDRAGRTSAL